VAYGAQAGIHVCIEDFGSLQSPYQTSDECLEVCQGVPGLKMCYDSGNMFLGDEDPVAFLDVVKDYVVHAHAKDWTPIAEGGLPTRAGKRYIGITVGQGELNYPAIIGALKALDYQGFLSFEFEGSGDPVTAAHEGTSYLLELINA
jgi:sugar phosphate isomerase/epimerase